MRAREKDDLGLTWIDADPRPAPRLSMRDRYPKIATDRALKYYAWRDGFRLLCAAKGVRLPPDGRLILIFEMPMPASWPKGKRAELHGAPHRQRPDLDNLVKAVLDALSPEDGFVHWIEARKKWAEGGRIAIGY